jgi:hypothetical protein
MFVNSKQLYFIGLSFHVMIYLNKGDFTMADFFLHSQLIDELYKLNKDDKYLAYAKMGAQGPDPFYYVIKSKIQKQSMNLADDMHDSLVNKLLISMTEYVKSHNNEILRAYFKGFLSHFILDVNIHPYIYYFTGEYISDDPSTYQYRGYHLRFERAVDMAYIRYRYDKSAPSFHKRDRVIPSKEVPNEIKALMKHVAKEVYLVEDADQLYTHGYHTMRKLLKLLVSDRTGIKKILLSIADMFMKPSPILLRDYPYHRKDRVYDYLNLNHSTWHHPITNEPITLSVIDIYQQALDETRYTIEKVFAYIDGDQSIDLASIYKNRSFNSGYDTSKPRKMIHFKLYDH